MDKILLNGLLFYGHHGLFPEEKKLGQRFIVDATLCASLKEAGNTDDLTLSIDYGAAYEVIKDIAEGEPKNLIEAVAEEVAAALLHRFPALASCIIKVTKPNPPIQGHYESVAVEIERKRNGFSQS